MSQFDVKMTELADKIKSKNTAVTGKLSVQGMIDAVGGIEVGGTGDSTIEYGFMDTNGNFQAIDLSGDEPTDSGDAQAMQELIMFKTGHNEPEYPTVGGGSVIEFYECASVTPKSDGEPIYEHLITLSGNSEAGSYASSYGYGIYYPEDLSVEQSQRVYSRKDGAYKLRVNIADGGDTGQITLVNATGEIKAATPYMALGSIWDTWDDDGDCNLFYPDEAETAWEDGCMPYYWGNIAKWGNGNMFTISGAGTDSVNGFYVRGNGCNEDFSAGCYESWINDNGTVAIYQIDDWITDEDDNNIMGLLINCKGGQYELPTSDWDWGTRITSASQFSSYTWRTAAGVEPLPVLSDAEPEKTDPTEGSWTGYKVAQSDAGYWNKSETLTEDLEITGYTPEVGKVYSADTTIACRAVFAEAVGNIVVLYHFDGDYVDATGNTTATLYDKSMDESGKFGGSLYGDASQSASYFMLITGLPELDAFTIEWWQKDDDAYGDGGTFMRQEEGNGLQQSSFLTVPILKDDDRYISGQWKHLAFVREKGFDIVTMYLNGKNVGTVEYGDKIGGREVRFYGLAPTTGQAKTIRIDELVIFDYPKYRDNFTPPNSPIVI